MRLPRIPTSAPEAIPTAGPGSLAQPGEPVSALIGGWSATRWQYTSATTPERSVDLVCDLGGSVSLSFSAGTFILTCDIAGRGSHSVPGTFVTQGDELRVTRQGAAVSETVRFRQAGQTLSLHAHESAWDFDGNGQEQVAEFVAVLVRL